MASCQCDLTDRLSSSLLFFLTMDIVSPFMPSISLCSMLYVRDVFSFKYRSIAKRMTQLKKRDLRITVIKTVAETVLRQLWKFCLFDFNNWTRRKDYFLSHMTLSYDTTDTSCKFYLNYHCEQMYIDKMKKKSYFKLPRLPRLKN